MVKPETATVNANEAPKPQQSMFSWAEFLAMKPVKQKRRSRKLRTATTSLFEWALRLEQQRENAMVIAGR